ncbi:MAG: anaerobic ribonucleoside-triphosphate reductase activating protein [Clostridia bacterium]|nr:anaerobic ribonucleoside-triphosphate reductase activating protein [Clostridia bacterium]
MKIYGLQKLSLVDYPGKTAAVLFTGGCNFRCPFCHNFGLVSSPGEPLDEEEVFSYLKKRKGLLDAVVITGGEPLIHPDIAGLIKKVRDVGYPVKLDTNGTFPVRLAELISEGLIDYVAMDIKNCEEKYFLTAGCEVDLDAVRKSVMLLMSGSVDFEFRTTAVKQLHEVSDFIRIGKWIKGNEKYYIQRFKDAETVPYGNLSAPDDGELRAFLDAVIQFVPNARLRG